MKAKTNVDTNGIRQSIMDGLIIIPFGNICLALSQETFKKAVTLGQEVMGIAQAPSSTSDTEKLLDAEEAGTVAGIPASWFLEAARQERIPHIWAGKYVRFRMSDITAALEVRPQKNFA